MKRILVLSAVMACSLTALADLVAYWDFEDGGGMTAADVSGRGQHARLRAADGVSFPQWTAGKIGSGALLFNPNAAADPNERNYLFVDPNDVNGDPNILDLTDAFTISMWVRRDVITDEWAYLLFTDAYDLELAKDPFEAGDPYDYFWSTKESKWQFEIGTETDDQQIGNWYHLAVTCDNRTLKKYVNGTLKSSVYVSATINLPKATTALYIASRAGQDRVFIGALDDIAIWAGSYLPEAEVQKLANQTATPLTVTGEGPLEPIIFTKEIDQAWRGNPGWKLLWDPGFNWDLLVTDNIMSAWWLNSPILGPGQRAMVKGQDGHGYNKWYVRNEEDYTVATRDIDRYGLEWIDPSWSGLDPNVTTAAAYITPGILLCNNSWGYQLYRPDLEPHEYKKFFKTYARIAAVNAQGAQLRIKQYTYDNSEGTGRPWKDPNVLNEFAEVYWPLGMLGDYVWKEYKHAFPKPLESDPAPGIWFELSIVGGNENTVVYIDEFNPVSNFPNNSVSTSYDGPPYGITDYLPGDYNQDSYVNTEDLVSLAGEWLSREAIAEPRNSGMLVNGDFYADMDRLDADDDARLAIDPIGWTFSGDGDYGIWRAAKRGLMNHVGNAVVTTPLGGTVAAYTTDMYENDPYGVLEQTASQNAVNGQTYYAMCYVLGTHPENSWYSWKDTATMEIAVNGVVKAAFSRKLSCNIWRSLYGTYTATAADAGKPISIRFSYANTHTLEYEEAGYMLVGYAYLGTTIPDEWPEGRANLLTNGGFEDLSALDAATDPNVTAVAESIRKSDDWGGTFVSGVPSPPGWVYEVPSGFDLANQGGIWASGFYGTPLPSPGLTDICIYTTNNLILGQVVGPLSSGVKYYLDMACGINNGEYGESVDWPSPAPKFHIELWRIPVGVIDGTVIYNAISGGNPNYVKIVEAVADAAGNISGGSGVPASKWQLIGTTYTAAAADTNVYVRIYGTGGAAPTPEFGFSDVYLSADKRKVPGGEITFDLSSGMQYDTLGPYSCYHAYLMGLDAPLMDLDGDCIVNITDLAVLARNWAKNWFSNITGLAPYN